MPSQVKIKCSKLIIDNRLQQRCHVTFLIYFFVTSRNLFVWCISAKENYYSLTKNRRKFQVSVTETCIFSASAKSFKSTCEKVESFKIAAHDFQVISKVSAVGYFYTHLLRHLFTDYVL